MKEVRNHQINFVVNDIEFMLIKEKMSLIGIKNLSSYLRKMAIDGYVINFNIPELDEIIHLLRSSSNNINQIAKKVNASGVIFKNEISQIQSTQAELWKKLDTIIAKFSKIK